MEHLPRSKGCFVCGSAGDNPRSLALDILWNEEEGNTEIALSPDSSWCGYEGIVHGGIIASVFDDAMAWAVKKEIGTWAMTGEMSIRYLRPVKSGKAYVVKGKVDKRIGRRINASGVLTDDEGKKMAEATALFLRMPSREDESGAEPSA